MEVENGEENHRKGSGLLESTQLFFFPKKTSEELNIRSTELYIFSHLF